MRPLSRTFPVVLLLAGAAFAQPAAPSRVFRAGAATSNITPPIGLGIVGGWTSPPSKYIHDELHSRCLVLDDGQTRLAFAVSDSVGIARDVYEEAKRTIREKTGLPVENMMMSATHTHSAVNARGKGNIMMGDPLDDYQRFLAARIGDCVLRAIHNLEPARIGWGSGSEPNQVFNRRWKLKPGTPIPNPFGGNDLVRTNPGTNPDLVEPAGPADPEISFISVQSASGRPIALLANYGLHYVGGVGPGHISGDYFAMFAGRIEELLGAGGQDPPFVGIMTNGASGDVTNNNYSPERQAAPRRFQPYERMRMVASVVAAEVYRAYQTIPHHEWVPLRAVQREIPMGIRVPAPEQVAWAKRVQAKPTGVHIREETYAARVLHMSTFPPQFPYILQAMRIGDLAVSAIPNEVFAEIGLELKKRSPFPRSFTISIANGAYAYLPTPEQHRLGGYETWLGSSRLEIEASNKIVSNLLEMFQKLKQ